MFNSATYIFIVVFPTLRSSSCYVFAARLHVSFKFKIQESFSPSPLKASSAGGKPSTLHWVMVIAELPSGPKGHGAEHHRFRARIEIGKPCV